MNREQKGCRLFDGSPILGRSYSVVFFKETAEIKLIIKANGNGDLFDIIVFVLQKPDRFGHPEIVDIGVDINSGFFFKNPTKVAGA